jgi:hypothetical protein
VQIHTLVAKNYAGVTIFFNLNNDISVTVLVLSNLKTSFLDLVVMNLMQTLEHCGFSLTWENKNDDIFIIVSSMSNLKTMFNTGSL